MGVTLRETGHAVMIKKKSVLLSLFGASGYRYKLSQYVFGKVWGVEGVLPAVGGVYVFMKRLFSKRRGCFVYEFCHAGEAPDLSALSVDKLAKDNKSLLAASCVGVLPVSDAAERSRITSDIIRRYFT